MRAEPLTCSTRPRREPRRDRVPDHPHAATGSACASVAVYSDADRTRSTSRAADDAVRLGPGAAADELPRAPTASSRPRAATGADAIHPGLRVPLRERRLRRGGRGGRPRVHRADARADRRVRRQAHGPRARRGRRACRSCPGSGLARRPPTRAVAAAAAVGFPLLLKSVGGGGGIGMRVCADEAELPRRVRRRDGARRRGLRRRRRVPRALPRAGPATSRCRCSATARAASSLLGDRDCSLQRRRQKVVEEAPAPGLARRAARAQLHDAARAPGRRRCATARRARSSSSSTSTPAGARVPRGEHAAPGRAPRHRGGHRRRPRRVDGAARGRRRAAPRRRARHAAPRRATRSRCGSTPRTRRATSGRARAWSPKCSCPTRRAGRHLGARPAPRSRPHYDPLLAKVVVHGADRADAADAARAARSTRRAIDGIETNLDLLRAIAADAGLPRRRRVETGALGVDPARAAGRSRSSAAGSSPRCRTSPAASGSGTSACRRAARWTTGRSGSATSCSATRRARPGLECTATGPTLRVPTPTRVVCLTGAPMTATLDGEPVPCGRAVRRRRRRDAAARRRRAARVARVPARARRLRRARRTSAVASTFTLGGFGGHGGRALQPGDVLTIGRRARPRRCADGRVARRATDRRSRTAGSSAWSTARTARPTSSPTTASPTLFATDWTRCTTTRRAPACGWSARRPSGPGADGGEAGLHPSNIHDTAYAVGAVDFTGDMPILLGPDGPSLGGFVCPVTVVAAERWKLGQLAPGDTVRFVPITTGAADELRVATRTAAAHAASTAPARDPAGGVLDRWDADDDRPAGVLPAERRRVPARRVRADGARPRPAVARPRAPDVGRASRVCRRRRGDAGHPVAAGPGRPRPAARRGRARRAAGRGGRAARRRRRGGREPDRAPPALVGRSRDARGDRALHAIGARRRAVVPVEHRVHPPHQRARRRRRRPPHRVRRRRTSCSGSATCTSARRSRCRSIRATGSSRRSTTRRARGRRRTRSASAARTCASTAWKDRAATSSSAARCRCGTGSARPATSRSRGCCASSTGSAASR